MSHLGMKSVLAVLLCLVTASYAADVNNPYKNAKVGDWAKYKQSMDSGGMKMEMEMKQTVTAKTETEVTLEMEVTVAGQSQKQSQTIKLNEAYNPMKEMATDAKEVGNGLEKITVGGKAYDTHWVEYETTAHGEGAEETKIKFKIWTCPTVFCGMIKLESDMGEQGKMSMALIETGSAK